MLRLHARTSCSQQHGVKAIHVTVAVYFVCTNKRLLVGLAEALQYRIISTKIDTYTIHYLSTRLVPKRDIFTNNCPCFNRAARDFVIHPVASFDSCSRVAYSGVAFKLAYREWGDRKPTRIRNLFCEARRLSGLDFNLLGTPRFKSPFSAVLTLVISPILEERSQDERQEVKAVPKAHGAILHGLWIPRTVPSFG